LWFADLSVSSFLTVYNGQRLWATLLAKNKKAGWRNPANNGKTVPVGAGSVSDKPVVGAFPGFLKNIGDAIFCIFPAAHHAEIIGGCIAHRDMMRGIRKIFIDSFFKFRRQCINSARRQAGDTPLKLRVRRAATKQTRNLTSHNHCNKNKHCIYLQ
jgi:hypothetical protein